MGTYPANGRDRDSRNGERLDPPVPLIGVQREAWRDSRVETTDPTETTDRATKMVIQSGSSFELFSAAIAAVLAIVGLAGYLPLYVAAIATIAVGFALLAQGSTIAARWREALRIAGRERIDRIGMSTEMFGGLAGVVLGVLALLGVVSLTLLPVAAVVLGVALLLGGPTQPDLAEDPPSAPQRFHVTRDIVRASSGVMVMGGLSAVVLGVIALAVDGPVVALALTALLCIAAALMLSGGSLLARFKDRLA
jgi:hypothetical protein